MLESSPSLRDLTDLVTPNYAAKWRVIAPLLGLSKSDIDIIEHDHGRSAINCCSEMWGKWLDTDTKATWREVLKAIDHKAVTEKEKGNNNDITIGISALQLHVYIWYLYVRISMVCFTKMVAYHSTFVVCTSTYIYVAMHYCSAYVCSSMIVRSTTV